MLWFLPLAVIASIHETLVASNKNDSPVDCIEHFSVYKNTKLDVNKILGTWYQVKNDTELFCADFQYFSETDRKAIAIELKPLVNETELNNYSLMAGKNCTERKEKHKDYFFYNKLHDKGIFDLLSVYGNLKHEPFKNPVYMNTFEVNNKSYMGIVACNFYQAEEGPIIFERQWTPNHTNEEIRVLESAFNKTFLIQ